MRVSRMHFAIFTQIQRIWIDVEYICAKWYDFGAMLFEDFVASLFYFWMFIQFFVICGRAPCSTVRFHNKSWVCVNLYLKYGAGGVGSMPILALWQAYSTDSLSHMPLVQRSATRRHVSQIDDISNIHINSYRTVYVAGAWINELTAAFTRPRSLSYLCLNWNYCVTNHGATDKNAQSGQGKWLRESVIASKWT